MKCFISMFFFLLMALPVSARETLVIHSSAGSHYHHSLGMKAFKIDMVPQMAFWLEDDQGNYMATIYVTKKAATGRWAGGRSIRRPDALPVWSHRRGVIAPDGLYMPDRENPLVDSVTGATPKDSFDHIWNIPDDLPAGTYRVFAEVNNSIDYNETFAKKLPKSSPYYNDKNGQPSLVWEGTITLGDEPASIELTPVGTGHPSGKDGMLDAGGLSLLTTARDILSGITIEYDPGQ